MLNKGASLDSQMRDLHPFSLFPCSVLMHTQQADVRLRGSSQVCKEILISAKRDQASPGVLSTQDQHIGAVLKGKKE